MFPPPSDLYEEIFVVNGFGFFRLGYETQSAGIIIISSIFSSLGRVIVGTCIGLIGGILVGVAISYSKVVKYILLPSVRFLASISPVAWIPFAIVLFGVGNLPAIFVVFIGIFFLITIATTAALLSVDQNWIKTARTLGASKLQTFCWVVLPSILPSIFLILRINMFAAWMSVLAAEMVGVSNGLGALVMIGRSLFNVKLIFVGMILIGFIGYILDQLILFMQKKVFGWQKEVKLDL
ncbi:MAG: ABC transporter permease [Ignavibacteriae bacterium]|nr:ABC transporter permease [Ignavibacteria bacterium]MBI3365268.1 ABC transporter permease [Ignavibacteriota bacterium]